MKNYLTCGLVSIFLIFFVSFFITDNDLEADFSKNLTEFIMSDYEKTQNKINDYNVFYQVFKNEYYVDKDSTEYAIVEIRVYPPRNCDDSTGCIRAFTVLTEVYDVDKSLGKLELTKSQERHVGGRWEGIEGFVVIHLLVDSILVDNSIIYKRFPSNSDEYYNDLWLSYSGDWINLYYYNWENGRYPLWWKFKQVKSEYKFL